MACESPPASSGCANPYSGARDVVAPGPHGTGYELPPGRANYRIGRWPSSPSAVSRSRNKMRDRRRDLGCLDQLGTADHERQQPAVGNRWATQHPRRAANDASSHCGVSPPPAGKSVSDATSGKPSPALVIEKSPVQVRRRALRNRLVLRFRPIHQIEACPESAPPAQAVGEAVASCGRLCVSRTEYPSRSS